MFNKQAPDFFVSHVTQTTLDSKRDSDVNNFTVANLPGERCDAAQDRSKVLVGEGTSPASIFNQRWVARHRFPDRSATAKNVTSLSYKFNEFTRKKVSTHVQVCKA